MDAAFMLRYCIDIPCMRLSSVRDGFCRLPVVACLHVQDCEPVVGVGGPVEDEVVRSVSVDVLKSGADTGQGAGITGDNACGEGVVDAVLD